MSASRDTSDDREVARRAADREQGDREQAAREVRERRLQILTETIYFEFDRFDLSEAARLSLDAKIDVLGVEPTTQIRIEGHSDARGSDEYNLALGMRRASAARRYLAQHGVDPDQIEVTSMGEERPVCSEQVEPCWRLNRRAEFIIANP